MIPTIIDVAISLIVIFFLLSTLVSFINEIIALIVSSRGKLLKNSLEKLLATDVDDEASTLVQQLYNSRHIYKLRIFKGLKSRGYLPAHISSESFSNAVLDLVNNKLPLTSIEEIKTQVLENMPDSFLKQKLLLIMAELKPENYNVAGLKQKIQDWYNGYMNTVTEVYRLKTRVIIFIISALLCGIMNIDSLSLSEYFWKNKAARDQMVAYGKGLDKNAFKGSAVVMKYDTIKQFPDGSYKIDTVNVTLTEEEQFEEAKAQVRNVATTIKSFELPITWSAKNIYGLGFWGFLLKILGIAVTACCLTLGAPFWYQLMKNLITTKEKIFSSNSEEQKAN